jgi:hypothetical protein
MNAQDSNQMKLTSMQSLVLFIGGGLLISLGDRAHIECGILTQNNTIFFGQAWWVVPMFGTVSLTLFYAYKGLRIWFDEPKAKPDVKRAILNAFIFLLAYASTGPFAELGYTLAAVLCGFWVLRVVTLRETRATIVLSLLIAVVGPIGETLVATLGLFQYTQPDLWLVHSWLPAIYLHGGLVIPAVEAMLPSQTDTI